MRERTSAVQSQRFSATNGVSIPPPPSERGQCKRGSPDNYLYSVYGPVENPTSFTQSLLAALTNDGCSDISVQFTTNHNFYPLKLCCDFSILRQHIA